LVFIALTSGTPRNDTEGEEKKDGIVAEFVKKSELMLVQANRQQAREGI
jgi:hypothetical protein